jgi:hypothetical protein
MAEITSRSRNSVHAGFDADGDADGVLNVDPKRRASFGPSLNLKPPQGRVVMRRPTIRRLSKLWITPFYYNRQAA